MLTPTGRTIAESIIHYFVRFFHSTVLFESENDNSKLVPDVLSDQLPQFLEVGEFRPETQEFHSVEELKGKTGLNPVYLSMELAELERAALFVDDVLEETTTSIVYSFPKGYVGLTQYWTVSTSALTHTGKQIESIMVLGNYEMRLYEDEHDHSITGFIVFEDSILMITAATDMLVKLKQGFGRLIRTETDTGVCAILDCRAGSNGAYHRRVLNALPACKVTANIMEAGRFMLEVKLPAYFLGSGPAMPA